MKPLTLRTRLTVWYTLSLLAVLLMVVAVVLWEQSRIGMRRVDRELDDIAGTVAHVIREELEEGLSSANAAREARSTVVAPGRALAILDERGERLTASDRGPWPLVPGDLQRPESAWTSGGASGAWRVSTHHAEIVGRKFVIIPATPMADLMRERHEAVEAMWVVIPIALLLASGGGFWLAQVGLRPITEMAGRAGRLSLTGTEDLGEEDRGDELGQFARAFNGLVARLRSALQTQQRFMADASHELRTPVTVILTAAEVTLNRDHRDEAEYREALTIVDDQARRVGRLVEDMLVLARADAGGYPLRPVEVYLDELVGECRRAVDLLASQRHVTIAAEAPPDLAFYGDEELLRRLLVNLVQNAVQHTPEQGTVCIAVTSSAPEITIRVHDGGPGIPDADRQRIFDRFVQLDPARRAHGSGLGLPIARWIAQAHGGSLVLESSGADGSVFTVSLPRPS